MAIHPTAIVDRAAELDETVEVGPFCVIDAHVRVDAGCRLYQGVYLTGHTRIGPRCVLHPGVVVGHEPQDVHFKGERSYCKVGADTVLREYVTIHRGTDPESETVIGDRCFLLAQTHVGHNCKVADDVTIINASLLGGHVQIGPRAVLGGCAGIHQFVRIGELAMIAGTARVTMDILPFAMVDANGRISGLNRIGLRRAGVAQEEVADIRRAYRTLFGLGIPFAEAAQRVAEEVTTPAGQRLAEFLAKETSRGLAGRPRSHTPTDRR